MTDDQKNINDIFHAIGKLEGTVQGNYEVLATKIDGMSDLQRVANGRTTKLENWAHSTDERLSSLEGTRFESKGIKASWRELLGWITGVGGIAIAFLTFWVSRK